MRLVIAESPEFSARGVALFRARNWSVHFHREPLDSLPGILRPGDGVIARFGLRWDAAVLERVCGLLFIAVAATGTDHIAVETAETLGIRVVSLAGHPGLRQITATPEHAMGLLLALLRRTVAAHGSVMAGAWQRQAFIGHQLKGKTVGLVGLGRTGSLFARMAAAFQTRVLHYDPYVNDTAWERCEHLADLAARADIIAVHATYRAETRNLLDQKFFDSLKPGAWLVNTARGGILDETALLAALESGRLAGAALDVLDNEPRTGQPLQSAVADYARQHDNLVLTPHISGATEESMEEAEWLLAQTLVDLFGRQQST